MSDPIPSVGLHRTKDHAYYWNGEGPYPGVTSIISMYDKSDALVGWAKRETASFAVRHLDALVTHRTHNSPDPYCPPCQKAYRPFQRDDAARKWVASIADYKRDAAADLGTAVHWAAEGLNNGLDEQQAVAEAVAKAAAIGKEIDGAVLLPYARQHSQFLDEYRPDILAIEYMGISRTHWYGGTGDLIAELASGTYAIDIKTWTKPGPVPKAYRGQNPPYYPTTGMQLAACARFDFIGKPNDPTMYPVPEVDRYAVLLVGTEDYALIPYAVTDETYRAFLACLDLWRWKAGEARTIVGTAA